jgi:hypothetical protein
MGNSAEWTLGKRLAYGDNVEKPLTVLVEQTGALRRDYCES